MQICIERIGKNAILIQIHANIPDKTENQKTLQPQIIDVFTAVRNYGKLSAKFLVSSVSFIAMVGFFFFSFTQTTTCIEIPLNIYSA